MNGSKKKKWMLGGTLLLCFFVLMGVLFLYSHKREAKKEEVKAYTLAYLGTKLSGSGGEVSEQYVLAGVEASEETKKKYAEICNQMLGLMKYNVSEVKHSGNGGFYVTVDYQTADVYRRFLEKIEMESEQFLEDSTDEKYKDKNADKIAAQMKEIYLEKIYQMLESACENVNYGERESMVFAVNEDPQDGFSIEEGQFDQFIIKILDIDEILD